MTEPTTSLTLIGRATAGDDDAWRRLVTIYGPLIYQWARRIGLQPNDASDAMQDTLASVWSAMPRFDAATTGATFRGWLLTILRRRIADAARRRPDERPAGSVVEQQSASDPQSPTDRSGVLHRAVLQYRQDFGDAVWRAFWETAVAGRDAADVASELGITRWAVYKSRSRVLQRLKTELADEFDA